MPSEKLRYPTFVEESTAAPLSSSSWTRSTWPSLAARCNALRPFWEKKRKEMSGSTCNNNREITRKDPNGNRRVYLLLLVHNYLSLSKADIKVGLDVEPCTLYYCCAVEPVLSMEL